MALTRLPDPKPDEWLSDYTQTMRSSDWYGFRHFGYCYGNFWAPRPCRVFPHQWRSHGVTDRGYGWENARIIRRCVRCGSQIHPSVRVAPPRRGTY
jgi:hypothetical protein